jgi:hypothetical protein
VIIAIWSKSCECGRVHARLAVVQDEHHVLRAEAAPADARPDRLVGDLVPRVGLHQALLSGSEAELGGQVLGGVAQALRRSASRARRARGDRADDGHRATISSPWKTGVAIARDAVDDLRS